ncbi:MULTISPECIES: NrtR DNA-binding winged helix domain-containing protein [Zobellia]|uniref:NUDIX hydrolase n=1 Tax=Zobellia TaxID=112040 RepID=UPI001BFF5BB8|nr:MULTISPECIES: NUDIX domain-containing protein [Zobellia]MBT9186725.1 NUDIX hydrolase [Zobellia russellii]MBU2974651.1 NUDIX hydrolase [Zobellia sp. B3R18]MDO6820663.1 NUDIX domain-containing protein [Zobellia sp. 1_MG-2023]
MDRTYKDIQQITLAVDCIIFGFNDNRLEVLLVHRGFEPEKDRWSLMGGFVGNHEDLDDAAHRVLKDLSGLEDVYMEQVRTFGKANRDPYERVVSTTYSALILKEKYNQELIEEYRAEWFPIDELPDLIFDHKDMVESAIRRLQRRVRTFPIVFNLLPEKFTLPQLQKLYEGIFQVEMDKRNFRKKLATMDFLVKLNEKDMSESKKGAFLYRFDEKKYNKTKNFTI